jgi:outer membrane protein assembly factor BamD
MLKRKLIAAVVCGLLVGQLSGCGGKKKAVDTRLLSPRDTYRVAREEIQRGNLRRAVEVLGRIDYRLGEDRALLEPLVRITTADATFYQNHDIALIDARALYLDYVTLYADHQLAPYALYQAGICSLSQVSAPSKDQTETYQAIRDLRSVEVRFPDSKYAVAARLMRRVAEARLVEHELTVGRYYLKKKAYPSAIERFQTALGQYPDSSKTGDMFVAIGEAMMRSGDLEQGRFYLDRVITDYAGTGLAVEAKKVIKKVGAQSAKN